jgi:hypothetical protein
MMTRPSRSSTFLALTPRGLVDTGNSEILITSIKKTSLTAPGLKIDRSYFNYPAAILNNGTALIFREVIKWLTPQL